MRRLPASRRSVPAPTSVVAAERTSHGAAQFWRRCAAKPASRTPPDAPGRAPSPPYSAPAADSDTPRGRSRTRPSGPPPPTPRDSRRSSTAPVVLRLDGSSRYTHKGLQTAPELLDGPENTVLGGIRP